MITPVETRWNSYLMMMRSVVQLRPALEAVKDCTHRSTDTRLQDLIPSFDDFDLIESIVPILTKFESVSDFIQKLNRILTLSFKRSPILTSDFKLDQIWTVEAQA